MNIMTTDLKNKKMKDLVLCNKRHDWDEESQSWVEAGVDIKPAGYEIGRNYVGRTTSGDSMTDYNLWISREEALQYVTDAELKELGYN